MFSKRLHWDLRPNRLSALRQSKLNDAAPVVDLTESNPTRAGFSYPAEEIFEALEKQIGLKLEKRKRTVQMVVIDHLEQKPTEN